jgi:uncharacterized membrane protein
MTENIKTSTTREIIRVRGRLKELIVVKDEKGNIIHKVLSPLMLEFNIKDVLQVIVGASIVAIPVTYAQESWDLGRTLPMLNIYLLLSLSLFFVAVFIYYNIYKRNLRKHYLEFIKRVIFTYIFAFGTVALLLTLIEQAPWQTDSILAFKRVVIVAFPAAFGGTLADMIK